MDALQTTHCASEDGDSQRTATFSPSLSQDSKVWVCLLHRTVMSLAHALWSRSSISVWDESPAWVTLYLDSGGEAELRSGCSWKEPIVGLCWSCLVLLPSLSLWMKRRERVCATSTGGISAEAVFYLWSLFTRRTLMFPPFFLSLEFQAPQLHALDRCLRSFHAGDSQRESPLSQSMQEGPLASKGSRVMCQNLSISSCEPTVCTISQCCGHRFQVDSLDLVTMEIFIPGNWAKRFP